MRRGLAVAFIVLTAAGPVRAAADIPFRAAVLQGLDKVTARISEFVAPVGIPVTFGVLEITARTCMETPPTEPPESAAFLQIRELPDDETSTPTELFSGWMFASTPGLSALEHPVYDVWVIDCEAPLEPPEGEDEADGVADDG